MTDPVELLRAANPVPDCSRPPLEALWARLDLDSETEGRIYGGDLPPDEFSPADVPVRSNGTGRGRGRGRWLARAVVLALVSIAVVVGGGALVLLAGHNRAQTTVTAPVTAPAGGPQHRTLLDILGVLRRPQTPADRDLGPYLTRIMRHLFAGIPVMSLVRVAAVLPGGEKVVLVPMRPQHGAVWPNGSGESTSAPKRGLRLAVFGAGGAACCVTPASILAGRDSLTGGSGSLNYALLVVPDGVAKVTLSLKPPVTSTVHNNVAALKTPERIENLTAHTMTWYGPNGATVKPVNPPRPPSVPALHGSVAPCQTAQLSIHIGHSFALAGTAGAYIVFANRSRTACEMTGWPHVIGSTKSGSQVELRPAQASSAYGFLSSKVGNRVVGTPVARLQPGQHADAVFRGADHSASGARCRAPLRWLRISPPAGGPSVRLSAFVRWLGQNMPACGPIQLTPVLPARDLVDG
jgi:uncharacterized protein DUF4232